MGQLRSVKPSRATGISFGKGELEASADMGMNKRDLLRFRWRLMRGPSCSMMFKAARRASGGPDRMPSSRYHAFSASKGTLALTRSTMG